MLRLLIQTSRNPWSFAGWALVSAAAHAAIVGGALVATRGGNGLPEYNRMNPAIYLFPPDRFPGKRTQLVTLHYIAPAPDDGPGRELALGLGRQGLRHAGAGDSPPGTRTAAQPDLPADVGAASLDSVYSILTVDSMATRYPGSAAPIYPPDLLAEGIEGIVFVQFVVDTSGLVDATTTRVLTSTHPGFEAAVRAALPGMQFYPAVLAGRRVRQLVEQHFQFTIAPTVKLN